MLLRKKISWCHAFSYSSIVFCSIHVSTCANNSSNTRPNELNNAIQLSQDQTTLSLLARAIFRMLMIQDTTNSIAPYGSAKPIVRCIIVCLVSGERCQDP